MLVDWFVMMAFAIGFSGREEPAKLFHKLPVSMTPGSAHGSFLGAAPGAPGEGGNFLTVEPLVRN